jgi:hypothetical protein
MILMEKQAKRKWCPFTRVIHSAGDVPVAANRFSNGQRSGASQCIGAACMAWRWVGSAPERGFCGLAGRPELMTGQEHAHSELEAPDSLLTSFGSQPRKIPAPSRG